MVVNLASTPIGLAAAVLMAVATPRVASAEESAAWSGNRSQPAIAQLHGSSGIAVVFDADGRRILTAGPSSARVWDAGTYLPLAEPVTFTDGVSAAVMSRDGGIAAVAAGNSAVIWEAAASKPRHALKHPQSVLDVAIRPDGVLLASGCADGVARIWEVSTGKRLAEIKHGEPVHAVVFSPDGAKLLTCAADPEKTKFTREANVGLDAMPIARVALWDVAALREDWSTTRRPGHRETPLLAAGRPVFSPDGRQVAIPADGVDLVDARTGARTDQWRRMASAKIRVVQFNRDGRHLMAAGSVFRYDGQNPKPLATILKVADGKLHDARRLMLTEHLELRAAALSPTGRIAALAVVRWHALEDPAGLYDVMKDNLEQRFEPRPPYQPGGLAAERVLAFSPDESRIGVGYISEASGDGLTYTIVFSVPRL